MLVPAAARRQAGVLDRRQVLAAGVSPKALRWRLEHGLWQTVHRGIYLTHSGDLTWRARAWAALLWCGDGSALGLDAAAYVWRLRPGEPRVIAVAVPHGRSVRAVDGVRVVQRRRMLTRRVDGLLVTCAAPTVIDLADQASTSLDDAIALAARACQIGPVSASDLVEELSGRSRHRHRSGLLLALGEIGAGAESLPEVWFTTRVVHRHGLPAFARQVIEDGGTRTDLKNLAYGINVEVDGQAWHAGERFHTDRGRDRAAAARGEVTVRLTYSDLDQSPCAIARDLADTLRRRGWSGTMRTCRSCAASAVGGATEA